MVYIYTIGLKPERFNLCCDHKWGVWKFFYSGKSPIICSAYCIWKHFSIPTAPVLHITVLIPLLFHWNSEILPNYSQRFLANSDRGILRQLFSWFTVDCRRFSGCGMLKSCIYNLLWSITNPVSIPHVKCAFLIVPRIQRVQLWV